MKQMAEDVRAVCTAAPVVPVIVIRNIAHARPLAEALVAGGLPSLEVTLRTDCALDAIAEMAQVPGAQVGAGTLRTPQDVSAAKAAGATFGVSPGATENLLQAVEKEALPFLPGVATAGEAMQLADRGYETLKFFPAEAIGGAKALGSLASPLPDIAFCPTGGISPQNASDYLSLANVICVGGSWVASQSLMDAGNWDKIEALAHAAAGLAR